MQYVYIYIYIYISMYVPEKEGMKASEGLNVHSNTTVKASSNCNLRKGNKIRKIRKIRMCISLMFLLLMPAK